MIRIKMHQGYLWIPETPARKVKIHRFWWMGRGGLVHIPCSQNYPKDSRVLQSWRIHGRYTDNNSKVTCKDCLDIIARNPEEFSGPAEVSIFNHLFLSEEKYNENMSEVRRISGGNSGE